MSSKENEQDQDDSFDDSYVAIPGYEDEDVPVSGGNYTLDDIENLDERLEDLGIETGEGDGHVSSPSSLPDTTELFGDDVSALSATEAERDSYLETLRNVQADFENYKKRVARDTEEFSEVKSVKLIGELLGVLDNFELALNHFDDEEQDEKLLKLKKGIDLVYSEFYSALEKQGLERIEAKGAPFDPEFHEAVMHDDTGDSDVESVVEVLRPGYTVRGKVIRPAMVKVAR